MLGSSNSFSLSDVLAVVGPLRVLAVLVRGVRGVRRRTAVDRDNPEDEYSVSGERVRVGVVGDVGERTCSISSEDGPECESPRSEADDGPRNDSDDATIRVASELDDSRDP